MENFVSIQLFSPASGDLTEAQCSCGTIYLADLIRHEMTNSSQRGLDYRQTD